MPTYEYRCPGGHVIAQRRPFSEREVVAVCREHGATAEVIFSPNGNIQVPIAFRQFLTGGEPAGGGLSWSDFHDKTEKELAHTEGVIPFAEWESQRHEKPDNTRRDLEAAMKEAKQLAAAGGQEN